MASNNPASISSSFEKGDGIYMAASTVPVIAVFGAYCVLTRLYALKRAKGEKLREEQLRDESKGYPVWFSRHEYLGACHHLVLYINQHKYELRLPNRNEPPTAPCPSTDVSTWPGRPKGIGFKAIHIGWTRLEHEELERKSNLLIRGWVYDMFQHNCQHFLKSLTEGIMDEKFMFGWQQMEDELSHYGYKPSAKRTAVLGVQDLFSCFGDGSGGGDYGGGGH